MSWHKHYLKIVWIAGIATIGIMVLTDLLWYRVLHIDSATYSGFLIIAFAIVVLVKYASKLRNFKHQWISTHQSGQLPFSVQDNKRADLD